MGKEQGKARGGVKALRSRGNLAGIDAEPDKKHFGLSFS